MIGQVAVFGLLVAVAQGATAADPHSATREHFSYTQNTHNQSSHNQSTHNQINGPAMKSAVDYLEQMSRALQNLNYYGTVVYSHDGAVESMKIIHKNGPDGEIERLVQLGGDPREVIRKNDVVTCYMSDSRSVLVGKRNLNGNLIAKLNANFTNFGKTYSFHVNGLGRVAGETARLIDIKPKDTFRYGYKLWINNDNALLLKSELVSPGGEVLERVMFAQLSVVDSIPESMLVPAISGESFTWHKGKLTPEPKTELLGEWRVSKLPAGFKITAFTKQQMPNSDELADHVVITDGLASISVYIEPFSVQSQPFVGSSRMGAINIYGTVVGDFQITVVGEVPQSTVRMIAESVHSSHGKDG